MRRYAHLQDRTSSIPDNLPDATRSVLRAILICEQEYFALHDRSNTLEICFADFNVTNLAAFSSDRKAHYLTPPTRFAVDLCSRSAFVQPQINQLRQPAPCLCV